MEMQGKILLFLYMMSASGRISLIATLAGSFWYRINTLESDLLLTPLGVLYYACPNAQALEQPKTYIFASMSS
jgi:hypothetical protein